MPTPISYLSGNTLSYQSGMVKKGTVGLNLTSSLTGNYRWWNGIEVTASQYLIYSDTYSTGASTESNVTPAAWSTPDLTDQSLLNLINTLPDRIGQTAFTTLSNALIWLNESGEYFLIKNSYENIVTSGLTLNLDAAWTNSYATGTTTWNDLSGSGNTFTLLNGVAFNSSDYGSLTFDGTDDYTKTTSSFMNGATQGTFEFWFQTSSVSGGGTYFQQRNTLIGKASGPDNGLGFNTTSNRLRFRLGADSNLDSTIELSTNIIYHVVGTWDSSGSKLYINGVLNNSNNTANLSWYTSQFETIIGRVYVGSAGASFTGKIYSARAYNRALSQSEILQNYHVTKQRFGFNNIVGNGLVLNLNAQNNISYPTSGTSWYDLTGNNNTGTLTNGPTFNTTERSIVFDGADDYVTLGDIMPINTYTKCVVFNISNIGSANNLISGSGGGTHYFYPASSNYLRTGHFQEGAELVSNTPIVANKWYHGVVTFSTSSGFVMYQNGVNVGTNSSKAAFTGGNALFLGSYATSYLLNGKIANAQIYNRVLTPTEVLQSYYQGNIVTNGLVLNLDAGNLVSYGGTGTLWNDLTNTTTGATLMNGPTYTTSNGGGIVLDGADDYILVNRTASLEPTAITMQCVFYINNMNSGNYPGIIAKGYWDSQTTPKDIEGYGMHIRPTTYNLWVDFNNNGTRKILQDGTGDGGVNVGITQNSLNFITVTIGSTGAKIYNNGINYYSDNNNYTIAYTGDNGGTVPADLWIGWMQYKGGTLNGRIYTASIYNRALTQSEVIQNFNAHKSRYGL
jgi:hypothetical protein